MAFKTKLALLFGPLLLTGGLLNYLTTPFVVKLISERHLLIEPGTVFYDKWIKTPVPFNVELYIFDIQNPKQIMKGQKPIVKEVGPFSFSQTREKKILKYSANKETVTYLETKNFKFNREKSVDDLNRYYVTPNVAFLSTINVWNAYLKDMPLSVITQPIAERFLSTAMEFYQQNLFINVTVDQMLFKGVHLNFVPLLQTLAETFGRFGIGDEIAALSNNSFSFFKYINSTYNGPYEVYTGKSGISKLTQLKKYKDKSMLDLWTDEDCNLVRGSDGIQFTPLKKDKSRLYVFTHEVCRTVTLDYKRDSEVRGIKTLHYEASSEIFMNRNARSGRCECTESFHCKHPGVIDLSPCWFKAPLYGSVPHFAGDKFVDLRKQIIILKPDESRHKSYLELDPITGTTLKGAKRGQLNAYIEKISSMRSIRAVKDELVIPLFWYEEYGEIDDRLEKEIKELSVNPLIINNYFMVIQLVIGSIFSVISCIFCVCCRKSNKKKIQSGPKAKTETSEELYLDNSYQKLTNLDDAESTKTESSTTSSHHSKAISVISKNSMDSFKQPEFILVQPMLQQEEKSDKGHHQNNTHSLALVPAYQFLPKIVNDHHNEEDGKLSNTKSVSFYKSQIENGNLIPSVNYEPPNQHTIDESMKVISRLIELNNRNMTKNEHHQLQLVPASLMQKNRAFDRGAHFEAHHQNSHHHRNALHHQQNNSTSEMTVDQRRARLAKQFSSQDSFDYE